MDVKFVTMYHIYALDTWYFDYALIQYTKYSKECIVSIMKRISLQTAYVKKRERICTEMN
jgi:hypothetical protein